jgi:hypothetical protein
MKTNLLRLLAILILCTAGLAPAAVNVVPGGGGSGTNDLSGYATKIYAEQRTNTATLLATLNAATMVQLRDATNVAGQPLIPINGTLHAFGDSQTVGINSGGSNYTSSGNLLPQFIWPNMLASNYGRGLVVSNYAVGATRLAWAVAKPKSHFNTMGKMPWDWTGISTFMGGWNDFGTGNETVSDAFLGAMQNGYEAAIARLLIDDYAGISYIGWTRTGTGDEVMDGWVTTGDNDQAAVTNVDETPFRRTGFANMPARYRTKMTSGETTEFTVTGARSIGLFFETDASGGNFTVTVNSNSIGGTYSTLYNSTYAYPKVVWIDDVPSPAYVKITAASSTVYFLAAGWVNRSTLPQEKTIIMAGSTANTANNRAVTNIWKVNKAMEMAASAFAGRHPVYFANVFNSYVNDTDQEPDDISHFTPVGNLHIAESFARAYVPTGPLSSNVVRYVEPAAAAAPGTFDPTESITFSGDNTYSGISEFTGEVQFGDAVTFTGDVEFTGNVTVNSANNTTSLSNLYVGGTASGQTATVSNQFVTLAQLEGAARGSLVMYFDTTTRAAGAAAAFGLTGTVNGTNYMSREGIPAQSTNVAATSANGVYVAAFISTNTYASLAGGLAVVDVYAYENSGGSGAISAEVYIINSVTKAEEYEFTPSPAYQTVPAQATPDKLSFSIPVTDYTSTTNFHIAVKIKVQESGTDPTIRIVTGGSYISHLAISVPSQSYVLKSGDTMTGLLSAPAINYTTNALTQGSPIIDFSKNYAMFTTNDVFTIGGYSNADAGKANWSVLFVTNSLASAKQITQTANTHTNGTWFVTNVSAISFIQYGNSFTNAICTPLW